MEMPETMQEEADANRKIDKDEMTKKMEDNQAKADADRKADRENLKGMIEEMNASQKEMLAKMERMTNVNQAKTDAKLKELTETIEKTQMELQTAEMSLDAWTKKVQEDLRETSNKTCAAIEETKHELQARLEAVETRAGRGNTPTATASTAPPPIFNRNTTWSVFRRQFEIVAEHNRWSDREKLTYLITALKGRAADVLYGIPKSTTYEETLQALEDRFGDQHFSAAYRCQLTTRTQKAVESLQDFATAIERATQRVGRLRKNLQSRQESGKATKDLGGKWPLYPEKRKTIRIVIGRWSSGHLLPLGRRRPTYKILKKTLKLESVNQAKGMPSGLQRSKHWTMWRSRRPPKRKMDSISVRVAG
jgi:hypothetical protein